MFKLHLATHFIFTTTTKNKTKKTTQPWKEQQGADSYRDTLEPNLGVHVGDAAVTLGGSVELADLFNAEALSEGLPHAGA